VPPGDGPLVGIYKAAIDEGHGAVRGARISVWAEQPDRLHAELIAPVGGVAYILDAGGGHACVVDVAAATAYVGEAGPGAIEALIGVHVSVADAVVALLTGASREGLAVARVGRADDALPESIRISDGSRSISLTRLRFERGTGDARALGTGVPPAQLAVRPIESFVRETDGRTEHERGDR
jgi:hypothetical protein